MSDHPSSSLAALGRLLPALLLAALLLGCLVVLRALLAPLLWAAILAYVTWPLYRRLRRRLGRFGTLAAAVMTLLVSAAVVLPMLWLLVLVHSELLQSFKVATASFAQGPHRLPESIRDLPWIGPQLQGLLDRYWANPSGWDRDLLGWMPRWSSELAAALRAIGRNLGKLALALLTLFFCYRDGAGALAQTRRGLRRLGRANLDRYVAATGLITRAVMFGFVAAAVAQGLVAGIGYGVVGVGAPVLLAALTGVLSIVPVVGTALVWGPIVLWLLLTGSVWKGLILLAWGVLLVHPTDNLLHPLLISSTARVPFLVVLLGLLGGLSAFGLVGIVVGPVLLGLALQLWREWATESALRRAG